MEYLDYNWPKLIVALDNINEDRAREIMEQLKDFKWKIVFKVNDLLFELWAKWIAELLWETEVSAMLDPKWHDISETIINYLRKLAKYPELKERTEFLTVHASNWKKALKKLMDEKIKLWLSTKVFAVTALTSLDDEDTQTIFDETSKHSVLKLTKDALEAWVDWIVCSPLESPILREVYWDGYNFEIITPWVRFAWNDIQDQKRVKTPADAIRNWSSHIVMWRDILKNDDVVLVVNRFFNEVAWILPEVKWEYQFEKLLYSWEWLDLLKYIWAIYRRPEWWAYCRLASELLSDTYINIWASERNYLVLERAWKELAENLNDVLWLDKLKPAELDKVRWEYVVMWAQMWSVRLSWVLAEKMWIETSIYAEKNNPEKEIFIKLKKFIELDLLSNFSQSYFIKFIDILTKKFPSKMVLSRHDIDLTWKKVILNEDIVTKWSTLEKMIEIVNERWWEVVAITCVWNRYWKDEFMWIPLISCFTPPKFNMLLDKKTLISIRDKRLKEWKSKVEIEEELKKVMNENEWIPKWSKIAEKPKNDWKELVQSMRNDM